MKLSIKAGSTSQSVNVFIRDSSSTTGAGLAAVAPAGGALLTGTKLYYSFTGANASAGVSVALSVLAAVNSAWSSAGIVTLDATNMIGWVRVDLPDAALAGSKGRVVSFHLYGGTNMAPTPFEIELTAVDNQSATAFMTGVNSLAPPANWNLESIDASGRVDISKILGTAISTPATAGILDVNVKNMNNVAATPITTIKAVQGLTTADTIDTYTGNTLQTGDSFARIGAAGAGLTALGDARLANLDATVSSRGTGTALDAVGVRGAVGMAAADLDDQLAVLKSQTIIK